MSGETAPPGRKDPGDCWRDRGRGREGVDLGVDLLAFWVSRAAVQRAPCEATVG